MHAVEVYWADLDSPAASDAGLHALLDREEQARAGRFRYGRDRTRFIARRGLLRQLLGDYVGCGPAAVAYCSGPYGKPALVGEGPQFSVSHSHGIALFAVASAVEVGCDIERFDERIDVEGTAERLFAPGEIRDLQQVPPAQRQQAFFRYWTQKEAYVKGLGTGLSHALDTFDLSGDAGTEDRIPGWTIASLKSVEGFYAAVAARSNRIEITFRQYSCARKHWNVSQ